MFFCIGVALYIIAMGIAEYSSFGSDMFGIIGLMLIAGSLLTAAWNNLP